MLAALRMRRGFWETTIAFKIVAFSSSFSPHERFAIG